MQKEYLIPYLTSMLAEVANENAWKHRKKRDTVFAELEVLGFYFFEAKFRGGGLFIFPKLKFEGAFITGGRGGAIIFSTPRRSNKQKLILT